MLSLLDWQSEPGSNDVPLPPKAIALQGETCSVGRGREADINLLYPWISKMHFVLTKIDGLHYIDVVGRNGVYLNGKRVQFQRLKDGDQIMIGGGRKGFPTSIGNFLHSPSPPYIEYTFFSSEKANIPVEMTRQYDIYEHERLDELNQTLVIDGEEHVMETSKKEVESSKKDVESVEKRNTKKCKNSENSPGAQKINFKKSGRAGKAPSVETKPATSVKTEEDNARRSSRAKKPNMKYVESDSDDNDDSEEEEEQKDEEFLISKKKPKGRKSVTLTSSSSSLNSVQSKPAATLGLKKETKSKTPQSLKRKVREIDCDYNPSDDDELPAVLPDFKKTKLAPPNPSAKPKKGRSKKQPAYDVKVEYRNIIAKWNRPVANVPVKTTMVEVLKGEHKRTLYNFQDNDVFLVHYVNGRPDQVWDTGVYNVSVKVNIPLLEYKIVTGTLAEHDFTTLIKLINKCVKKIDMNEFNKPQGPPPLDIDIEQPKEIKLELKDYQLHTLGWMMDVEDGIGQDWEVSKLVKWKESGSSLEFDLNQKRVFMAPVPKSEHTLLKIRSKGGIFADEMGLGKTITLLALIFKNRRTVESLVPDPAEFNYQSEFHLPTSATLVVAPSHLTAQWKHEVEQHCPELKVFVITTKPQYEKVTYVDLMAADLVVVSVQFLLNNKAFTTLPSGREAETQFMNFMRKPGQNPLLQKAPNLAHFLWWRIVCDEAHELLTYDNKYDRQKGASEVESLGLTTLCKFKSKFRWYVTGTPFPHAERSLRAALKFLEVTVDDPVLMNTDGSVKVYSPSINDDFKEDVAYTLPLFRLILDQFYVRNTKHSIGEEYDVPDYVEELILLTMSDIEKGIYERGTSEQERRQLCCHLQIAGRIQHLAGTQQKTLEEVKVILVADAKQTIEKYERMINAAEEDIKRTRRNYAAETKEAMRCVYSRQIENYKLSIKRFKEEMEKNKSAVSYFDSIGPRIHHSEDEPCVICLDPIQNLTVTPCGHMFCRKCIQQCTLQQGLCPTCRHPIQENKLIEVKDAKTREEMAKHSELMKLTEQYGTKMAYLIFYLRYLFKDDPKSRVIIFSQWDSLLHKIGDTLSNNDITNVFVKGNVHCRNKAIMSFRKQEKTRVIMLSLEHAASGTNLVEASHVILIDPVSGTKEEAIAVESQAIGRAHRMGQDKQISVVRMIMKDTIEHQLYLRNNPDEVQQVEFDFEHSNKLGPQVVRKLMKMPEPDPIYVKAYLDRINPSSSSSTASAASASIGGIPVGAVGGGGQRGRRRGGGGGGGGWRNRGRYNIGWRRRGLWGYNPYESDEDAEENCSIM